jgi:hypothetical protein
MGAMIRALILLAACFTGTAHAGPWGLELGLSSAIGAARFAGDPTVQPVSDPNNFYSLYAPDSATSSQGTGLAGAAGISLMLTHKRRASLALELVQDGQTLTFNEDLNYFGTDIKRATAWSWSGFRPTLLAGYAWPIKMGPGWALAPRLGGGLWYETVTWRQKLVGYDNATPAATAWPGAPQDDWGWIASVGMDWLRLGPGSGPSRIGLDLRWREGRASQDAAAGADKPVRVIDAVLTVPVYLWVL